MHELERSAIPYRLVGISALERFFGLPHGPVVTVETDRGVVDLARTFDQVHYPGLPNWDALIPVHDREVLVRCDGTTPQDTPALLRFSYDPERRAFADPEGLYPDLKEARTRLNPAAMRRKRTIRGTYEPDPLPIAPMPATAAATIAARLPLLPSPVERWHSDPALSPEFHRLLLTQIVTGRFAARGLQLLCDSGYLAEVIPELQAMNETEHSKEHHPEGNVWAHTMQTFGYRKHSDTNLALALLFHDSGKPKARPSGAHRFSEHADLGAATARTVLGRLGFDRALIDEVAWLIRFHMMPAALERLPDHRRNPVMSSPLFPTLLELYRCDLSSTFRGPEPYYQACRVYRRYLKRNRSDRSRLSPRQMELIATQESA